MDSCKCAKEDHKREMGLFALARERLLRRQAHRQKSDRLGLTLVELAIVVLVIGILMTIIVMNLDFSVVDKGTIQLVKSQRINLQSRLKIYEMENPPLEEGDELTKIDGVSEEMATDPFQRPYFICRSETGKRHICSYGQDGEEGGEGKDADFYLTGNPKNWPAWLQGKKEEDENALED